MKKSLFALLFAIAVACLSVNIYSQKITTNEIPVIIDYIFTGEVQNQFDSVFITVININEKDLPPSIVNCKVLDINNKLVRTHELKKIENESLKKSKNQKRNLSKPQKVESIYKLPVGIKIVNEIVLEDINGKRYKTKILYQ